MPTMGIKHRADIGFRKFRVLSKLSFGRTVKCFAMLYVSYPRPLAMTTNCFVKLIFQGFSFLKMVPDQYKTFA